MNDTQLYTRQLDLVKPQDLNFPIALIGAGGIGSHAAHMLTKIGCQDLTVYDADKVALENIPSQFYKPSQVDRFKVEALRENIQEFIGTDITGIAENWQQIQYQRPLTDMILISAVDSMDQRSSIWNLILQKLQEPYNLCYYIDARMGGEYLNINIVDLKNPASIMYYINTLFPDSKGEEEKCTAKSIAYNTGFCGALISSVVKKLAKQQPVKHDISFDIINLSLV